MNYWLKESTEGHLMEDNTNSHLKLHINKGVAISTPLKDGSLTKLRIHVNIKQGLG
jgi:hypothetical protein